MIGVDEHVWRHTRRGDNCVTVIIDLPRSVTGPDRHGCWTWSKAVRNRSSKPRCPISRLRPGQMPATRSAAEHRAPRPLRDPLYTARRTPHTGQDLLTEKQKDTLQALFTADDHAEVEATWGLYQRVVAAYREPDRTRGKQFTQALIGAISAGDPAALTEVITLGRTLKRRAGDVLAYFAGPTPATAESNTSSAPPSTSETDQLHRPITPRDRQIQTPITPSNAMSLISS